MTRRFRILAARFLIPLFLLGIVPQRPAHAILPFFVPLAVAGYSGAGAVSFGSVASAVASALIGGTILALAITPSIAEAPTGSAIRVPTTDTGYSSDAIPAPTVANPPGSVPATACWRATLDEIEWFGWDDTCYPTSTQMCAAYGGSEPMLGTCQVPLWDGSGGYDTRPLTLEVGPNGSPPAKTCANGYRLVGASTCMFDSRLSVSDNKVDVSRYGTEMTVMQDVDSSNPYVQPKTISVNGGTNNAIAVSGASEAGEPRRVVVEAMPDGGSRLVIQDQKTDAAGNSYLANRTIVINQAGTVTSASTHATAESLSASTSTNAQTGATTTQYTVAANPASTYSPAVVGSGATAGTGTGTGTQSITFPSDYARQGESQSAANSTNTKIDALKAGLLEASPAPNDPAMPEWAFFDGTFSGLLGWSLPSHTSQCPTGSFSAFDRTYTIDSHCNLIVSHWSALQSAMAVVWVIAALFIVLAA